MARQHHPGRRTLRGHGYFKRLGPGLITGAADDDPSGIGTYSQVGAAQGVTLLWTAPFLLPLAAAVQESTARLGIVTGKGLATLIRERFPRWVLPAAVGLVTAANTLNIAADISAMASAIRLLVPVPATVAMIVLAVGMAAAEVLVPYHRYARVLRWFGLSLLAYVAVLVAVHVDWGDVMAHTVLPRLTADRDTMVALTAIAGTTISPYLFFWQTAEEVEELTDQPTTPAVDRDHLVAMRVDVWAGMASGVAAMFAIMCTAAVTLHAHGLRSISSAAEAAQALEPIAGTFAKALFTVGIVGLGLLAVPVLAGSTAYAVAEAFHWREGLSNRLRDAPGFYGVIAGSVGLGLALGAVGVNPIRMLYWAAILNGVTAPPLILLIALLGRSPEVLGRHRLGRWSTTGLLVAGVTMTALPVLALAMG